MHGSLHAYALKGCLYFNGNSFGATYLIAMTIKGSQPDLQIKRRRIRRKGG